jgi:hypothetical protein
MNAVTSSQADIHVRWLNHLVLKGELILLPCFLSLPADWCRYIIWVRLGMLSWQNLGDGDGIAVEILVDLDSPKNVIELCCHEMFKP